MAARIGRGWRSSSPNPTYRRVPKVSSQLTCAGGGGGGGGGGARDRVVSGGRMEARRAQHRHLSQEWEGGWNRGACELQVGHR